MELNMMDGEASDALAAKIKVVLKQMPEAE